MSEENPTEISMNHNILVLDTLRRMRDAESGKHYEQYFTHFKFALQLVIPYISGEVRKDIEDDMDTLEEAVEQVKGDKELNDITKSNVIIEVKRDFADTHKAFLMSALTKTGIVKVLDEGVVDFTKNDMEDVAHIIRNSGKGLEKSIDQAVGKKQEDTPKEENYDVECENGHVHKRNTPLLLPAGDIKYWNCQVCGGKEKRHVEALKRLKDGNE